MQPCTLHYVVTVDNCTTLGRHFYSTATIADSCFGLIHSVFRNGDDHNTSHDGSLTLLRRIFAYWYQFYVDSYQSSGNAHIPDIREHHRLMDLVYVGNILELTPFLDRRVAPQTPEATEEMQMAMLQYRHFQREFAAAYHINAGSRAIRPESVFNRSLVEFASAIIDYINVKIEPPFRAARIDSIMDKFKLEFSHLVPVLKASIIKRNSRFEWGGPHLHITPRTDTATVVEYWGFEDMDLSYDSRAGESGDETTGNVINIYNATALNYNIIDAYSMDVDDRDDDDTSSNDSVCKGNVYS
jgi:hypothetical protein